MNKPLAFILAALISFVGMSCSARTEVPAAIQQFLNANFPSAQIAKVERENSGFGVEYEIKLSNGVKIDFDRGNNWEHVDCKKSAVNVPARIVPKSIASYVRRNYPQTQIIEIERERYGYDVKLSNRLELEFDASGKFIRIDD